jgi:hypothetical protein
LERLDWSLKEEKDFLKKLFDQHKEFHSKTGDEVAQAIPTIKPKKPDPEKVSRPEEIKPVTPEPEPEPERDDDDDDWNVELVRFKSFVTSFIHY